MQTPAISATGPAAFGVIAERFRRAGQADKAVALCREGLEKFPEHLSARVTLGWSLLDLGEYDEAFAQLKSVNKRAPDNLAAIRGLAELHERGIGVSFDAMPDADGEMELDPVMPAFDAMSVAPDPVDELVGDLAGHDELDPAMPPMVAAHVELDPVMPPLVAAHDELDPVMPAFEAPQAPAFDLAGDLDPIFEPETPMVASAPAAVASPFEIEDVIDVVEPDSMFDLSSLLALELDPVDAPVPAPVTAAVSNVIAMPEPVVHRRALPVVVDRAPLALRDQAEAAANDELSQWLARVRERRTESVSQYMAG